MLSVVIFNFLHKVAMNIRRNNLPFGGIQLIIVGEKSNKYRDTYNFFCLYL